MSTIPSHLVPAEQFSDDERERLRNEDLAKAARAGAAPKCQCCGKPPHRGLCKEGWLARKAAEATGSVTSKLVPEKNTPAAVPPPPRPEPSPVVPFAARVAEEDVDPEMLAMSVLAEAFGPLTPDQVRRVLTWAGDRFGWILAYSQRKEGV